MIFLNILLLKKDNVVKEWKSKVWNEVGVCKIAKIYNIEKATNLLKLFTFLDIGRFYVQQ